MAKHILLINGPNLNLLGLREPHLYGPTTLPALHSSLAHHCATALSPPCRLSAFQSNHEGAILDVLHSCHPKNYTFNASAHDARDAGAGQKDQEEEEKVPAAEAAARAAETHPNPPVDAIIINPGGLTHTSVALRDALVGVGLPFVEVHVTNVHAREAFRHRSFLSEKAVAVVCGLGVYGYTAAAEYLARELKGGAA